jgi:DUF1009 family protein
MFPDYRRDRDQIFLKTKRLRKQNGSGIKTCVIVCVCERERDDSCFVPTLGISASYKITQGYRGDFALSQKWTQISSLLLAL